MSLRSDGRYRCDRCDRELENGGVHEAAIISDQDPRSDPPGAVLRVLHLCRTWTDGDGNAIKGCVNRVLTAKALAAWPGLED